MLIFKHKGLTIAVLIQMLKRLTSRSSIVKLYTVGESLESLHSKNASSPLPEFCEELRIRINVISMVSNEERAANPNEEYFIAKIVEKVRKLEEDGTYSIVLYHKNDWIV